MSLFSRDTRPEARRILLQGLRRMTPAQKLARMADLSAATRLLSEAGIRRRHPAAGDREVRMRRASLVLDRQTMKRLFSWDAREKRGDQ